mmetsp:Transcript_8303/g.16368  ORF Transcript_8303/g.16368 Transcript_8303/m.16368 type:complete len:317 (+) Transcript_8303:486-1436(+)
MSRRSPRHDRFYPAGSVSSQWGSLADTEDELDNLSLSHHEEEMSGPVSDNVICFEEFTPDSERVSSLRPIQLTLEIETQTEEGASDPFYEEQNSALRQELENCTQDIERLEGINRSLASQLKEEQEKQKTWNQTLQDLAVLVDGVMGESGTRDPKHLPNYLKTQLGLIRSRYNRMSAMYEIQQRETERRSLQLKSDSPQSFASESSRKGSDEELYMSVDDSLEDEPPRQPLPTFTRPEVPLTSYRAALQDLRDITMRASRLIKPARNLPLKESYRSPSPYNTKAQVLTPQYYKTKPPLSERMAKTRAFLRSPLQRH